MPLTEPEWKQVILLKLHDDGALAEEIDLYWTKNDDKSPSELQYAYTLIDCIESLLGGSWRDFDVRTPSGTQLAEGQPFEHLVTLARQADQRRQEIEERSIGASAYGPVVANMTAKAPIEYGPGCGPDPNSVRWLGIPRPYGRGRIR